MTDAMIEGIVRDNLIFTKGAPNAADTVAMLKSMRDQVDEAMEQPAAVTLAR